MMAPAAQHAQACFGPTLKKTFASALAAFIQTEFPHMGGPIVVDLFVQKVEQMVSRFFPPTSFLKMGQVLWFAVSKDEKPSYGKTMDKTKIVPVILTLISPEDIKSRIDDGITLIDDGITLDQIRRQVVARLCTEAYEQGAVLSVADLAFLIQASIGPVSTYLRTYQKENDCTLPYRGTIHDMGRSVTHKGQICKKRVVEKKSVSQTARETHHSPEAVQRYEVNLNRVLFCLEKGLNVKQTSFVTRLSENLVIEYQHLVDQIKEATQKQDGHVDYNNLPF